MLRIINIILIITISIVSFYLIKTNYNIYILHYKTTKLIAKYELNQQINNQLMLTLNTKKSNSYIKDYATNKLQMHKPSRIHTLD
jgi:cell division protein FtsL